MTSVVKREDVIQRVTVSGKVVPNFRSEIFPGFDGYLRTVFVKLHQKVKKGDPLVLFTPTLDGSSYAQYPIRAPFNGVVTQINNTEGEYMEKSNSQKQPVVRIDDLSRLFVAADVAEIDYPKVTVGQDVLIRISPILDRTYKGVVRETALAAKETKESRWDSKIEFSVRIEILDKDDRALPGMSAVMDIIPQKREKVLSLRHEYVYMTKTETYVILENGEKRNVRIGLQSEDSVEILDGLKEGERVRQVDFTAI
jgi:HlyD family secretion protein